MKKVLIKNIHSTFDMEKGNFVYRVSFSMDKALIELIGIREKVLKDKNTEEIVENIFKKGEI